MIGKSHLIPMLMLVLSIAACEKKQKETSSKVNVDTRESTERSLEMAFQQKVRSLRTIITYGEQSLGLKYRQYTYWGLPIKSQRDGQEMATFYFKKDESSVGPDINIEFADSSEMVSFFLTSYNSARVAFAPDLPSGKIYALEALDLLRKEAEKTASRYLKTLSKSLDDMAMFLKKPFIVKVFEGKDPEGHACYVKTTNDLNGDILNVRVGYKERYKSSNVTVNFLIGPYTSKNIGCHYIEFDLTKQKGFSASKWPFGYGITYERNTAKSDPVLGTFKGSQTDLYMQGSIGLSGAGCQTTTLALCHDRAQIQSVRFDVGGITLFPILGGTIKQDVTIDCRNLIQKG